ncbi:hypothetical protein BESB_054960 [Besnoitia besnoiti]|uniref:Transmembrane protein n=1 Tax=Besnoitia besnoiti TaxID=94643 RepID=A0A2A9MCX6_BESBE|nr:hypothetical protein BESB_054960 [Besnoitia besnoiti]PFH35845.1 hypothetical protein BESB_054960 [Besnoitia besnoiti]
MMDWQLLAIIGLSVAAGLLLVLIIVVVFVHSRRRCAHMHYHAEVVELKENLKAAQVEKEEREAEFSNLRRSVADFDAEKSLLLKRLESCDRNSTPEEIRRCLRELQLHLAIQSANSSCVRRAVNTDYKEGPPALLAEIWLVHGEPCSVRDDENYPTLDDFPPPFSRVKRAPYRYGRCNSNAQLNPLCAEPKLCDEAFGQGTARRFNTCAAHGAPPPSKWHRRRHSQCCQQTTQSAGDDERATCHQTQTFALESNRVCGAGDSMPCTQGCPTTVEAGPCRSTTLHSATEDNTTGEFYGEEKTVRISSPVVACTTAGSHPGEMTTLVDEESCQTDWGTERKTCNTAVIPAHTFAPEYIFVGEQWLPGAHVTATTCFHAVPLVRLAKYSRRDHSKTESIKTDLYQQTLPDAYKLEKVLLSSQSTSQLDLVSSSRDHIKLQSRALVSILPSLEVSTKAVAFPHLSYCLIEYSVDRLTGIRKTALRDYVGETLNQPLYILLRVFERSSMPGATPPASPGSGREENTVSEHEEESWKLIYEAPPVRLTEPDGCIVDDDVISFREDCSFHYKHTYSPAPPTLFEAKETEECVAKDKQPIVARHTIPCQTETPFYTRPQLAVTDVASPRVKAMNAKILGDTRPCSPRAIAGRATAEACYGDSTDSCRAPESPHCSGVAAPALTMRKSSTSDSTLLRGWGDRSRGYEDCWNTGAPLYKSERWIRTTFLPTSAAASARVEAANRFKDVCLLQQGLLYEDDVLSVTCVVGTTVFPSDNVLHASVELSIVNNALGGGAATLSESLCDDRGLPTGFHSVRTVIENVEQGALSCFVSPIVRAPPAGPRSPARAVQTISATIMQPFQIVPEVTLEAVLPDGTENRCTFPLPLVITQFMRPVTLSPAAFMQLWFDGTLHSRLMSLRLSRRLTSGGFSELTKVATLNGKFKATDGIKHRLAENSIFAVGELAAVGDMPTDSRCLVRVWQGEFGAASAAKLEVKADDRRIAAAVFELLAYVLEDGE